MLLIKVKQKDLLPDGKKLSDSISYLREYRVISVILGPPLAHCYTLFIFIVELLSYYYHTISERSDIFAPLRLQLHGTIYLPDSFVMMLRYCANLKAIRYD